MPIVVVLGMVMSVLEGLGIGLLIPLFSGLFGGDRAFDAPAPLSLLLDLPNLFSARVRLPGTAAVIFGLIAAKSVLALASENLISWIDGIAGADLQRELYRRLLTVRYPFYLRNKTSRLLRILSEDSWHAAYLLRRFCDMLAAAASAIVFAVLLLLVNWAMFLAIVAALLVIRAVQSRLSRAVRRAGDAATQAGLLLSDRMYEGLDAARVVRLFGQVPAEGRRFHALTEDVRHANLKVSRLSSFVGPGTETAYAALFIGVLLLAHAGGTPTPVLIAFLVLLYRMQPFLIGLEGGWAEIAASRASIARVEWLMDDRVTPPAPTLAADAARGLGHLPIVFEGVDYIHPGTAPGRPALRGARFELRPGRVTALVGRSGSGKSTVVNLLCRLLEPDAGRLTLGGVDVAEIDPEAWLSAIGVAGQDIDLVEGSLRDNIAYGCASATLEDVREAARLADIADYIETLPEGYETPVGGRGLSLSGGQRQRIGVARALARKPRLLVLDEATSAVDGLSERAILRILRQPGMTAVVVSHRVGTLSACHDGVVLDEGRVVEAGPLDQLDTYRFMAVMEREPWEGSPSPVTEPVHG